MEKQFLDCLNPEYTDGIETWRECAALYAGGKAFRNMLETFLPQNPSENLDVYETRKKESSYSSYLGPIVDYFVSWLFSQSFTTAARDASGAEVQEDPYYAEFRGDVGGDVNMNDFMRERMTRALVEGRSYWLVVRPDDGLPPPTDKAVYDERKLGTATLQAVERGEIYDWETDDTGKLLWCLIHSAKSVRAGLGSKRDQICETWKYYDHETVKTYSITYEVKKPPGKRTDIPLVDERPHGCAEVPLIALNIKDGLWVGNRVRDPQIEHFRLNCANSWLIRRTCYAMPVLNLEDQTSVPVMGSGYFIAIGVNEKFGWSSPPNTPFDIISKQTDAKRDEIFRIVHQMAQGMDNNAETVGRSADSKGLDVAATRIMLNAYGAMVRKAIEETYEILSDARGETHLVWSVEGFNGFDTTTAGELIVTAANAQLLGIPSSTFMREVKTKAALAMLPEAAQQTRNEIRDEIKDAYESHPDTDMTPDAQLKLDLQKMKDETALKLQKLKSKTTMDVQQMKQDDVKLELQMASGGKMGAAALKPGAKPGAAPAINKGTANLIKADS